MVKPNGFVRLFTRSKTSRLPLDVVKETVAVSGSVKAVGDYTTARRTDH